MTRKLLTTTFLIVIALNVFGQRKSYFPNLTRVSIDATYNVFFGYDKSTTHFINKPCYLLDNKDPLHCYQDSVISTWTFVAKFKNEFLNDSVNIVYSEGMSADPGYIVSTKADKIIGRFSCVEFYINATGTIYTEGHVNNMFNRRRKFQIQNDTIFEVRQPFCYVGMKGKTLKEITLYNDKVGNEIVAQLPKNYEIEILLADGTTKDFDIDYYYLVKTDFGLVGWLRITNDDLYGTVLKDLFYNGD
jgi:hypothetical protein